ncbi:hypothetical protein CF319_g4812 [Tilletia indica]|nr:hypothetical protein CF319_g4812 [Tilletia indica]
MADPTPSSSRTPHNGTTLTTTTRKENHRRSEYLTGILLLILVVILWTASNFLTNTVLTHGYNKPFAVTFANTSSFALYLIPFLCIPKKKNKKNAGRRIALEEDQEVEGTGSAASSSWYVKLGFILPERPISTTTSRTSQDADPEEAAALLSHQHQQQHRLSLPPPPPTTDLTASIDSLRPRSIRTSIAVDPSRPSSIDGRRPRGNLVHASSYRSFITQSAAAEVQQEEDVAEVGLPPLTLRETAVLAGQFTIVWFIANWSLNAGLGLTSVASGTTLSSASGFFTLGLGALLGVERFSFSRLGAVTISFIGVVLVSRADAVSSSETLVTNSAALSARAVVSSMDLRASVPINAPLGDFLAIVSAFSYAVYVTLLKLKIGSEDRISMPLFFGFVGAINIICLWPFGLILHFVGFERFEWPSDTLTWMGVFVNMSITFISDFAYLLAMLKSSPLVATVGLSLTIPLALAGDVMRGSHSGGWLASVGSIMVLFSFVAIGLADLEMAKEEEGEDEVIVVDTDTDAETVERGRARRRATEERGSEDTL